MNPQQQTMVPSETVIAKLQSKLSEANYGIVLLESQLDVLQGEIAKLTNELNDLKAKQS